MNQRMLQNELVEVPGEPDAYYKVDITVCLDGRHTCTLPDGGRCCVKKEYSWYYGESFAWKIVDDSKEKKHGGI